MRRHRCGRAATRSALNREDDRIQVITVAELFQGKRLDLPMARTDAVKAAAAIGDADKQAWLI